MMAFSRTRSFIKRFALALAAAQLLAYAAAPLLESVLERTPGPAHFEAASDAPCVPTHGAANCLACQLLTLHARQPEVTRIPDSADVAAAPATAASVAFTARAPDTGFLTRAPPPLA